LTSPHLDNNEHYFQNKAFKNGRVLRTRTHIGSEERFSAIHAPTQCPSLFSFKLAVKTTDACRILCHLPYTHRNDLVAIFSKRRRLVQVICHKLFRRLKHAVHEALIVQRLQKHLYEHWWSSVDAQQIEGARSSYHTLGRDFHASQLKPAT